METSAESYTQERHTSSTPEATGGHLGPAEGIGLGALLILLSPLALAAWFAIGSAVYRAVT